MHNIFRKLANKIAHTVGTVWAFFIAISIIALWLITGPIFNFSDTWQLVINTTTTIITFLMVFLIQNTQNRDSRAIHLKLDELIRAVKGARTKLLNIENVEDTVMEELHQEFQKLFDRYNKKFQQEICEKK
ncbi:MAG: low affinity iron permease family protein [Candidatus Woesebacteria bacterium]|jgi:low affinity Fe/Cu permease